MATQSSTYGLSQDLQKIEDVDGELRDITLEVHHYLYNFGHHWLFLAIGKTYFQKCNRSWVRVTTHLEKFLQDPRHNYSLLMLVLGHEMEKFPPESFYGKHLKSLERLVSMGPHFSISSHIH